MVNEREHLKGIMSQFVDLLIDAEITELRNVITTAQASMSSELLELKKFMITEINSIKDDLNKELLSIRNSVNEQQVTPEDLAQKETTIYKHLQSLAGKVDKSLKGQKQSYTSMYTKLEERVHQNEDTLFVTRDDHEKIAMLLQTFATGLTELSPSVQSDDDTQDDTTTEVIIENEQVVKEEEMSEPVMKDVIELPNTMDLRSEPTKIPAPKPRQFILKPSTPLSN